MHPCAVPVRVVSPRGTSVGRPLSLFHSFVSFSQVHGHRPDQHRQPAELQHGQQYALPHTDECRGACPSLTVSHGLTPHTTQPHILSHTHRKVAAQAANYALSPHNHSLFNCPTIACNALTARQVGRLVGRRVERSAVDEHHLRAPSPAEPHRATRADSIAHERGRRFQPSTFQVA